MGRFGAVTCTFRRCGGVEVHLVLVDETLLFRWHGKLFSKIICRSLLGRPDTHTLWELESLSGFSGRTG